MSTNTEQKTGALHLRLMDNEEQYSDMLAYLLYYNKDNEHYTTDVLGALEDGLENYNRFQKLDNALSPRFIKIEKRIMDKGEKLKKRLFTSRSISLMILSLVPPAGYCDI